MHFYGDPSNIAPTERQITKTWIFSQFKKAFMINLEIFIFPNFFPNKISQQFVYPELCNTSATNHNINNYNSVPDKFGSANNKI